MDNTTREDLRTLAQRRRDLFYWLAKRLSSEHYEQMSGPDRLLVRERAAAEFKALAEGMQ